MTLTIARAGFICAIITLGGVANAAEPQGPQEPCIIAGPQTPRDITSVAGTNQVTWPFAPASTDMNLCDIHTHTSAEHRGPGFLNEAGDGQPAGFICNETANLTEADLAADQTGTGVKPGETIEVHWVYTSCDVKPGPGLASCLCDSDPSGNNPELRVETQVFLVVNDDTALNFSAFDYAGDTGGKHQPKMLPTGSGDPVAFLGSTTGPSFNSSDKCSPFDVTWSVRPSCLKVNSSSVNAWLEGDNVFDEDESHEVRGLVTNPAFLSPIN